MLHLVEHFFSIQGEGRYTGVPSLFFRFGGCNMRCAGYGCVERAPDGSEVVGCDTVYAVDKGRFGEQWRSIETFEQLIAIMQSYTLPPRVDVVLTGGEPLLYAEDPLFVTFLEHLVAHSHRVTFETNGAISVDFERFPVYASCIFALSVKLSNSGEPVSKRIKPEVIRSIASRGREAFFKFTVDAPHLDAGLEAEIAQIAALAPELDVYCMPMGGGKEEIEINTEPVIEYCKRSGHIYSDRLHIRIWDANRGV